MEFGEYQARARQTNIYPKSLDGLYAMIMGLCSEAGEVADKVKKAIRDNDGNIHASAGAILHECGDVQWYLSQIADRLNTNLDDVADMNLRKLASRAERGKIGGSGDDR